MLCSNKLHLQKLVMGLIWPADYSLLTFELQYVIEILTLAIKAAPVLNFVYLSILPFQTQIWLYLVLRQIA